MKKIFVLLLFIFTYFGFAEDDTKLPNIEQSINLNTVLGVGCIRDVGDFGDKFNCTPVFTLGIEYPIVNSKKWSFKLNTNFWQATSNKNPSQKIYHKISDTEFSQFTFSLFLKWNFLNINNIRNSFEVGYFKSIFNNEYSGIDLGYNLNFQINYTNTISISYNFGIYSPTGQGGAMLFNFLHLYSTLSLKYFYSFKIGI